MRWLGMRWLGMILAIWCVVGCKVKDPLYCDEQTPCTDPARPFCDIEGEYPASEGIGRTCIPDPRPDGGPAADEDAGPTGPRDVTSLAVGFSHTCAVLSDGALRCWGKGIALGYVYSEDVGDDEHPYEAGDVPTGGTVKQVAAGDEFTCALYEGGAVRCWGLNDQGQLGLGHTKTLAGNGETPDSIEAVELGGEVTQITAGMSHVCALLTNGDVRCWGQNEDYQLAQGNQEDVGDDELPIAAQLVDLGGAAASISAGATHTCAVMTTGSVRCWGSGPFLTTLGYPGEPTVGDDDTPADLGDIVLGGLAAEVTVGLVHACARIAGTVRCWGNGTNGSLGYGNTEHVGDDEQPQAAGDVDVAPGPVAQIVANGMTTCARLETGAVRCWGNSINGELGYGNTQRVGDDETPRSVGDLSLGGPTSSLSLGPSGGHSCALLDSGEIRCWGVNRVGQLGYAHTENIGDDESPGAAGSVRLFE